jgi:hypothetical protein
MKTYLLILFFFLSQLSFAQKADERYFELRVYYCNPGKLDALITRFRDHAVPLFKKHGIDGLGYWVPTNNPDNAFYYLMAYPNKEARDASWKAFGSDPQWQEAAKKSEENYFKSYHSLLKSNGLYSQNQTFKRLSNENF